jgi:threonine/homoserine/homoserine lactone efflux protein
LIQTLNPAVFFTKGVGIGFAIAAPVGPIGVLCIRRSLAEGRQVGLATGLGAATADAAYGFVAAFGLTAISSALMDMRMQFGLIGGVFLCYLGVRTFLSKPAEGAAPTRSGGLPSAYVSTVVLTLANPMTIISFVMLFASLGLGTAPDYFSAGMTVAGVFIGSALWWILLSSGVAWFRMRVTPRWMQAINQISGCVILAFGFYSIARSFFR